MEKYYPIRLDVMPSFINVSAEFTQNDTETCGFNIDITKNGIPIDITGTIVVMALVKPSGKVLVDFANITEPTTGKVVYDFDKDVLNEAGEVQAALQIYSRENKRLSTARFEFIVTNDIVTSETITEDDNYPILTQLLNDFQNVIAEIPNVEDAINDVMAEYNNYLSVMKPDMLQATADAQEAADNAQTATSEAQAATQLAEQYITRQVIGHWTLTTFIENVSAGFKLSTIAPSLLWNRYAVYVDESNVSGILSINEEFITNPLVFEAINRLTIRFFDERTYADEGVESTVVCRINKTVDTNGIKSGELIKED